MKRNGPKNQSNGKQCNGSEGGANATPKKDLKIVTKEDIRLIAQEELKKQAIETRRTFTALLNQRVGPIEKEIEQVKNAMDHVGDKYDSFQEEIFNDKQNISSLFKLVAKVQDSLAELDQRLTKSEQRARACNVEIQCVPEQSSENLFTLVRQIGDVVSYNLKDSDVHDCIRVAKIDNSSSRPRSIVVQLASPRIRNGFIASVIAFNKRNPKNKLNSSHLDIDDDRRPIFVGDHLAPGLKKINAAAKFGAN